MWTVGVTVSSNKVIMIIVSDVLLNGRWQYKRCIMVFANKWY